MWRSFALDADVTSWRTPPPSTRKFNDRDFIVTERFDGAGEASYLAYQAAGCATAAGCQRLEAALPSTKPLFIGSSLKRNHCRLNGFQTQAVKEERNYGLDHHLKERWNRGVYVYIYLFFDWCSKSWKLNASTVVDFWNFTGNFPVQAIYVLLNNNEIKNTF